MTAISESLQLIKELYNLNYTNTNDPISLSDFIDRFRFHSKQSILNPEYLQHLLRNHPNELLYITDIFHLHYVLLRITEYTYLLGPFSSAQLSDAMAGNILRQNRIKDITVEDFLSYYNLFPVLTENTILHIIESIFNVHNVPSMPIILKFDIASSSDSDTESPVHSQESDLQHLKQRYYYEQQFFRNIEDGDVRNALSNFQNMRSGVKHLKQRGIPLANEKQAAAITRTTVRLAAMSAGLPVYRIDRLSQTHSFATRNAETENAVLQATEKMIRDFCNAILQNKNLQYSVTTQSILYFFERNYPRGITLDELSAELSLSKKQIIAVFKKETGYTPISYLNRYRLRRAASLLSGTGMSIRKICAAVGIPDENYFIKLFRKEYGVSPQVYRKNHKI